ncbi:Tim44 domain-containing protein [Ramlibacter tataouinensis]|uniref:Tim44-like domain-containing protein n=1 Tax=Ramlibacter tataouinensis (strain ATCC BAA-407 / DSM 14655 / LMG 21543 / TTB310) TaxID=365046 RepID=F5XXJ2_RAMTT|nr:Tim44-like domain-containing protein [Ramlibacter tataouinensis]AEG91795.1 Conserved hypothetical protein [Ramlibacter tataouinensis TTB310]
MKKALTLLTVVLALGLAALDADAARRLGGGKSSGMQRDNVTAPAKPAGASNAAPGTPGQAPAAAAAPAAATAPATAGAAAQAKRSWMGPLAGIAAGLGLAALASHLGFGEELAAVLLIALLAMAVLAVAGLVLRRRAGQPTMAGMGGFGSTGPVPADPAPGPAGTLQRTGGSGGSLIGSRLDGVAAPRSTIPQDFDAEGFVRNAKANFLALQAAHDARDLDRLGEYLTPEMLDAVRAELAERDDVPQTTEVFGLQAEVLDVAQEPAQYVVSVRFTGSIRHAHGTETEDLDEIWHLAKPRFGTGGWLVAGIQQA